MTTLTLARWSKLLLLAAIALFFTIVAFNNITDFDSNYQFVRHTLSMDTTFPGNHAMYRALTRPALHLVFYLTIIAWECLNAILCWGGVIALLRARNASHQAFQHAKRLGIAALTAGLLLWFVAFECIGGEWFLMWQSHTWNGQEAAFRMFMMEAAVLILLQMPEFGLATSKQP
jgi:predicted small integral membrane protein